ncbi:VOC family protein [Alteraurantiacibacter palmitatis]|uniref:VOC family protein n=1 Tax=Alteraurantiacibacter palmitatis TaxID=2054628 RepID=A0ABV7E8X8_9SPHN
MHDRKHTGGTGQFGEDSRVTQELGFGQPMGGVAQTAFIVPDLEAAIRHWATDMRAGPFFVLPHLLVPGQTYRGAESRADVTLAMGFAGHMMIELIQPLDDNPSVYRETIEARGYGYHHMGIACADVEADVAAYSQRGWHEAYRAAVPTGGEVVYLDNGSGAATGFIELLPVTPGMDATFTRFWEASRNWDGRDPIRPFA